MIICSLTAMKQSNDHIIMISKVGIDVMAIALLTFVAGCFSSTSTLVWHRENRYWDAIHCTVESID